MPHTTNDYYNRNASAFANDTVGLDLSSFYDRFLKSLPPNAAVLDAGCGAGRDAKNFLSLGLSVTAFDSAPEMVRCATEYSGLPVRLARFEDLSFRNEFDGIWACASLLHIPSQSLPDVLRRLFRALKPHGLLYCSFKYGMFEGLRDGRYFTDMDEVRLSQLVAEVEFRIEDLWVTDDLRQGRGHEKWLNALLRAALALFIFAGTVGSGSPLVGSVHDSWVHEEVRNDLVHRMIQ